MRFQGLRHYRRAAAEFASDHSVRKISLRLSCAQAHPFVILVTARSFGANQNPSSSGFVPFALGGIS